jgi:hypothetical protein
VVKVHTTDVALGMSNVRTNSTDYTQCPPQNIGTNIFGDCTYYTLQICDNFNTIAIDTVLKKGYNILV